MSFFHIKAVSDAFQKGFITTARLIGATILAAALSMESPLECALTGIVGLICFTFALKAQSIVDVE